MSSSSRSSSSISSSSSRRSSGVGRGSRGLVLASSCVPGAYLPGPGRHVTTCRNCPSIGFFAAYTEVRGVRGMLVIPSDRVLSRPAVDSDLEGHVDFVSAGLTGNPGLLRPPRGERTQPTRPPYDMVKVGGPDLVVTVNGG